MDIVKEANRLLRRINFSQTGEASNDHCRVEVQVTPLSARNKGGGSDNPQDPSSDVIVHVFPSRTHANYDLFVKAAQQHLGLTFTNCRCRSAGNTLGLSNGRWCPTGISVSFVHNHGCLKAGFKLQLRKHK